MRQCWHGHPSPTVQSVDRLSVPTPNASATHEPPPPPACVPECPEARPPMPGHRAKQSESRPPLRPPMNHYRLSASVPSEARRLLWRNIRQCVVVSHPCTEEQ